MALKRWSKLAAVAMTAVMLSEAGLTSFVPLTAEAREKEQTEIEEVIVEEAVNASGSSDNFTWDNATVYFVMTDRFENGDDTNDHSYGRSVTSVSQVSDIKDPENQEDAKAVYTELAGNYAGQGEKGAANYQTNVGTFHGGDLAGLTKKLNEGYFDELGVNAIWITAPYEQVHGAICGEGFKHYAYHGYYALDFTEVDANMGTEDELETFIDTAHEHGIRVLFDVVMNHTGYPDAYTIAEYYGKDTALLSSNWQETYFNTEASNLHWYLDYGTESDKNGASGKGLIQYGDTWNSSFYTTSWLRMTTGRYGSGYTTAEGTGLELCSSGLPDFKTENGSKVDIPDILQKKWTKEGRYDTKVAETKAMLNECGYGDQGTVTQYLVAWLSNWVREYGVDGFRCDTAKHVEVSSWKELKDKCKDALADWRAANPDKAGADWTDDFWMTGEVYDYNSGSSLSHGGVEYGSAFDSLINFGFQGVSSQTGSSLESTYSSYAADLNSSDKTVLSYIASHDKGYGSRAASAGTALLLCPGAVQIYYGDEYGRDAQGISGEQGYRSQMSFNLTSEQQAKLSNWQKIGKFRKNHASVGAGQHSQLSTSPYTFSRTYHLGQEDEDKVVVALPTYSGTFDVTVGDIFADGETVTDAYSGETYTVSGGKVSVTCDSNGVILLEEPREVKASVGASITSGTYTGTTYSSETIDVKLNANKVTSATYSINGGKEVAYNADDVITLGGGAAYEEKTVLALKGISEDDGSEVTKTVTYQKCKEPAVGSDAFCVKVLKSEFTTAPTIWVYDDTKNYNTNGTWPGDTMVADGDYWSWSNDAITDSASIIIVWGDGDENRSTPDNAAGLVATGTQLYKKGASALETMSTGDKATVTVKYVDEAGNDITGGVNVYRVGAEGDSYTTSAREIEGYTLKETPKNAAGTFTADEITVTYVYSGGVIPTTTPEVTVTTAPVTTTPEVTVTTAPVATVTTAPVATVTTAPVATVTTAPVITTAPSDFSLDGFVAVKTKNGIGLYANTSGATGNVRYMYTYEKNGKEILITNFQSESRYIWTTAQAGTYKLHVYAINNGVILEKAVEEYTVR